jgi:hypothetical protein
MIYAQELQTVSKKVCVTILQDPNWCCLRLLTAET